MATIKEIKDAYLEHIASYEINMLCSMSGDPDAEIAIIGEFPSDGDLSMDKPFASFSGKYLWDNLRKYNILRPQVYTTTVVKRPVTKKDGVPINELTLWQEALQFEISLLSNCKFIICCGNVALNVLTGNSGITHYRGSMYEYNGIPVFVTENPSIIQRMPETEVVFAMDIKKAIRAYRGDYKQPEILRRINPSFSQAMAYIAALKEHTKAVSIDIEVTGMETACIGLGYKRSDGVYDTMCINFRDAKENRYTTNEEFILLQAFAGLCDDENILIIAQNGNFDSYFMGYKDHCTFKIGFDTLLAHHTLYPRLPHNLGFLTSQYADFPYYKDEKDAFKEGGDIDRFWNYNCTDCAITYIAYEEMLKELKEQGLHDFFFDHVMRLQPHLSLSTVTGIAVDLEKKAYLNNALSEEINHLEQQAKEAAKLVTRNPDLVINLNSPTQLKKLLYDTLKLKHPRKSADAKARKDLLEDARVSIDIKNFITLLSRYAKEKKFHSTYVATGIDADGRFRAEFKQYGVSKTPGRLSSSKTLWGSGGNAQNQPQRAYEMYLADKGCVIIYFDLAQAEARYVAWDAWITSWIEDFEKARVDGKFDAHRSLASLMYKIPYDDVPKDDFLDKDGRSQKDPLCDMATLKMTLRYVSKRCRHGLNYRMHIARLAETTGMSYSMAASNYYIYHRTTPELQVWWRAVEKEIKKKRMLFNSYGRRFITLERLENSDIMDSIIAFRPQSTIGDKTQRVWYQCHEDPEWNMNKARIALNVHDALYGIATPEFADKALSIMKKYAEEPIMVKSIMTNKVAPMIIPADCKKSVADENGLHRMSNLREVEL